MPKSATSANAATKPKPISLQSRLTRSDPTFSSLARRRDHERSQSGRRRTAWSPCASLSAVVGISGGVEPDALGRCPGAGAFPGFGSLSADSCWCSNSPGSPPSPTSSSVLYMGSAISGVSRSHPMGQSSSGAGVSPGRGARCWPSSSSSRESRGTVSSVRATFSSAPDSSCSSAPPVSSATSSALSACVSSSGSATRRLLPAGCRLQTSPTAAKARTYSQPGQPSST